MFSFLQSQFKKSFLSKNQVISRENFDLQDYGSSFALKKLSRNIGELLF